MKILVSACLLGNPVRYDGASKPIDHPSLDDLAARGRVVSFCPEVAGGLPVPRAPAEIQPGSDITVVTRDGDDVTRHFLSGAQQALDLCRQHGIRVAVMTESSPSCGSSQIYDGSFSRTAIAGAGVTAALLRQHGIAVFNQHQLEAAVKLLNSDSSGG